MTSNSGGYGAPIDTPLVTHKQTTTLSAHRNRHELTARAGAAARPQAARPHSCRAPMRSHATSAMSLRNVSVVCAHAEGAAHHQDEAMAAALRLPQHRL
eukprot:4367939-Prymnesium_polylepis.1